MIILRYLNSKFVLMEENIVFKRQDYFEFAIYMRELVEQSCEVSVGRC